MLVALPNEARFVAAYLAVRLCGAVFVNVTWQWRRELVAVAEETDAAAVLLPDRALEDEALAPLAPRVLSLRGRPSLEPAEPPARRPEDVAWLAYSSGTTGRPKGAVHTEAALGRIPAGFIERYGIGTEDAILVAAPVGHAVGFIYGVQLALRARCRMALLPGWDAVAAADLALSEGCTFVAAPTPFLLDVVELAEERGHTPVPTLRFFLCGGAPVSESLLARARAALPGALASAYYGTSECGGVTTCPPDAPADKVLATDGLPLPGMDVSLLDGELLVRGTQMAHGYWAGDEEGCFREDGWFATGDTARLDGDGYIRITGRRKETILRGAVNVAPVEVEEALLSHPNVRDAALVGIPEARLGERLAAAVVARKQPAPSLEELREHCRALGLAKVKWPEAVVALEKLPRSPAGKLLRGQVASEVARRWS